MNPDYVFGYGHFSWPSIIDPIKGRGPSAAKRKQLRNKRKKK